MIRVILVALFMFIVFIVSLIMLPLEWLIGKININAKDITTITGLPESKRQIIYFQ